MAQKYETVEVINTAKSYLKDAVGSVLIHYFELDSNSYYEYKNFRGKTKWKKILARKRTKGDFVNGNDIRFTLKHPDFLYAPRTYRNIYVKLNSALNLSKKIDLQQIPDFLLEDNPTNWLTHEQIDSIANQQNLKKPVKPLIRNLIYNYDQGEYYWMIINTLDEGEGYSDCEILHIAPITGIVNEHTEERIFVIH